MIIESSANIVRADLARLLVSFKLDARDQAGMTMDIIEYLALRMADPSDLDVLNLALFVQRELDAFVRSSGHYAQTIEALTAVALSIKLGHLAFARAISAHPLK